MDCQMIGAFERRLSKKLVFVPHRAQQTHRVDGRQKKDESHSAETGHQDEAQAASRNHRPPAQRSFPASFVRDNAATLAPVYRSEAATLSSLASSRRWGLNLTDGGYGL